jgi:tetratricopeptide (TPR) repeat protein
MASRDGNSRGAAQYLVNQLSSMQNDIQRYAPERAVELRKVTAHVQQSDPYNQTWQRFQRTVQTEPIETALAEVDKAPAEQRDNFYQQLAWREFNSGNEQQALQIVREKISDLGMREQFLQSLNQQAAQRALSEGKLGEARNKIAQIADPMQRAMALISASQQIASKDPTAAISLLDEARSGFPQQVEDEQQYSALASIANAYAAQKSDKAFELLDPLIDKLNDLAVAAQMMNGFGAYNFQEGELLRGGGNISNVINQLSNALGAAGRLDTARTKLMVAKLQRPELRSSAFMDLARSLLEENSGRGSKRIRFGTRSFAR